MNSKLISCCAGAMAVVSACSHGRYDAPRAHLASALRDTLGSAADPQIAYLRDSTHLMVELLDPPFANVSDSEFTRDARSIARFALAHYDLSSELDSVQVMTRDSAVVFGRADTVRRKGMMRIGRTRDFSVDELRNHSP